MSSAEPDPRVPGYLGRVLNGAGEPAGTCFQVAPGVLATAWHVLDGVGAGEIDAVVAVDPLAGGDGRNATVAAIDPVADLAVLRVAAPLDATIAGLTATDAMRMGTPIVITGFSEVDDPEHAYSHIDAGGEWAGSTTRDRQVPLGRVSSKDVVRGMSGAPVRERDGDLVAGVVSARYNSADGWLRDSVLVTRCERLATLCNGIAAIALADPAHPATVVDLLLEVGGTDVRLHGGGIDVSAAHRGVRPGLANAVHDVRRARASAGIVRATAQARDLTPGTFALDDAGRLLAESFLPAPVADALKAELARAEGAHQAVRLGIACPQSLAGLPWEALPDPRGGLPLALGPLVSVHRRAPASPPAAVPGPLRILVAIASPDHGGGSVLDYERELRNVLAAVRTARQGNADVRVVAFATTAAIRSALEAAPAHVLHISGHGSPGSLVLERDDGAARTVDADTFIDEAIPPGGMPAVIALAACFTNAAAATGAPSFAARLLERGAAAVIASETSVTDEYATRVFARIYGRLADAPKPDVIAAVCDARRLVQAELDGSPDARHRRLGSLGEWAVLSVLAPAGEVVAFDPSVTEPPSPPPRRITIGAVTAREVGDFVGRRREQRQWPAELLSATRSGIVLHGIGGVGKTTLAEELVGRVIEHEPGRALGVLTGPLTVEGVMGEITAALRRGLLVRQQFEGVAAQALGIAARTDLPWADRLKILREHVLGAVPLLVVLDNFEDNLDEQRSLRDPILAALLAAWLADPGRSRLLVTCRYPFTLPDGAERLAFKPLGPLSAAETRKLIWSLPALDRLTDEEADRVWRMVGGHPRSLEYLDALLSRGEGRYPDITARLAKSVTKQLGAEAATTFLKADHELDGVLAEVATLAADDVLLDDLLASLRTTPGAETLLIGASAYREPVDVNALLFQVGEPDESAATVPDRKGAHERIRELLEAAGIPTDAPLDANDVPPDLLAALAPHIAELQRLPTPPRTVPENLAAVAGACLASSLLSGTVGDEGERFFAHRWTATELDRRLTDAARADEINDAHVRAADYWRWRVSVRPPSPSADVHDLLEARHHLLAAGDVEHADVMTEAACVMLHTLGSWDEEATLIHDTLARLAATSERRAAWIYRLGTLAHHRGDYAEADKRYQQSLHIAERFGDQHGMATNYGQLGILARDRGDYAKARQHCQQALEIHVGLGNEGAVATGYHQLGILAHVRGDYTNAQHHYQQALDVNERLGEQAGMASNHGQLGSLARDRGDYTEARQRYQQALQIYERLRDQAGMAAGHHELGILAQHRGDFAEANERYQQALQIAERLGDQRGMAACHNNLGAIAQQRGDYAEAEQRYQQALHINERIGDQADMATGHHNLGMLAQARGDYTEAAQRYQQSLQIRERLGNQAGIATSLSQLGILGAERGDVAGAVGLHGRALAIRMQLGVPRVQFDVRHLQQHRTALGEDAFRQALTAGVGAESAAALIAALDELAQQQAKGDAGDKAAG